MPSSSIIPVADSENFWRKYKTLGPFPDRWYNQIEIVEAIGSFHLESRDVVSLNNERAARAFYKQRAVINDKKVIQRLISSGVACRIKEPLMLLQACRQPGRRLDFGSINARCHNSKVSN